MKKFGQPNLAIAQNIEQIPTPIGQPCEWCKEKFLAGEDGLAIPVVGDKGDGHYYHVNCFLRGIVGSVGHQEGSCSCYGGTKEDPPGLTKRQAADAAVELFRRNTA